MRRVLLFGATKSAIKWYEQIEKDGNYIVAFVDNDEKKIGGELYGKQIIAPLDINSFEFDSIIIISTSALGSIRKQLLDMGIDNNRIDDSIVRHKVVTREQFARDFATVVDEYEIVGCVAEAGVYQGEFAAILNECYANRKLYLFDTFEGFNEKDVIVDNEEGFSTIEAGNLGNTSIDMVMKKMRYPDNVIVRKGYFPETAVDIEEQFVFVNIDFDLFLPTKNGLHYFWPRMSKGGIILVHDYFAQGYYGIKKAVDDFAKSNGIVVFPVGDSHSIAMQKW